MTTTMPAGTVPRRSYLTTARRQNRSCDSCRRGKRACDATKSPSGEWSACTNCTRTSKSCTFEWLQSSRAPPSKAQPRQTERTQRLPDLNETQRRSEEAPFSSPLWPFEENGNQWLSETPAVSDESTSTLNAIFQDFHSENGLPHPRRDSRGTELTFDELITLAPETVSSNQSLLSLQGNRSPTYDSVEVLDYSALADSTGEYTQLESDSNNKTNKRRRDSSSPMALYRKNPWGTVHRRQPTSEAGIFSSTYAFGSPSLSSRLHEATNKRIISESLLRIYHDSMENALSCWLTEKTCPYETEGLNQGTPLLQESMTSEWGPNWSNRISTRVCNLDRAAASLRDRPLSPSESRTASLALDAAIMAFASQWAHLSEGSFTEGHSLRDRSQFDRSLQEQLWYNARGLLQSASYIDSFKVSFAHIIFAFVQRPLDIQKYSREFGLRSRKSSSSDVTPEDSSRTSGGTNPSYTASNSTDLDEILNLEGPPIFLETAQRQLFAWRHKWEGLGKKKKANRADGGDDGYSTSDPLSSTDMKTFNLLFWLGVMLETLSSAINNRPLVVSDEDSIILRRPGNQIRHRFSGSSLADGPSSVGFSNPSDGAATPWGTLFLNPKHRESPRIIRWPCMFEDAAEALCDAAPVKVLLYRKVKSLQTLAYRQATPEELEEAIQDALGVYKHWNSTYGQLIHDFIANHDELPVRLQSWYVILTGHWHLAVFLLADAVEAIDHESRGLPTRRRLRRSSDLILQIRKQSAFEIAGIARASCPDLDSSFNTKSEFHDHLKQGALLTEPWTDILIRAFGKACCLFLDWLYLYRTSWLEQSQPSPEILYESCATCIKALQELGRKSDIAHLVAVAFTPRLEQLRLLNTV